MIDIIENKKGTTEENKDLLPDALPENGPFQGNKYLVECKHAESNVIKQGSEEINKLKLFIAEEKEKRALLIDYIKEQLVDGVDYGRIHIARDCEHRYSPDQCKNPKHWSKPSLLKPGSEKIVSLLKLTAKFEPDTMMIELLKAQSGDFISVPLICKLYNIDGTIISEGRGSASINKNSSSFDFDLNKQIKIAEKRSQTDAVLRMGFSFYFTQDLEDMPKDPADNNQKDKQPIIRQEPAQTSSGKMSFDPYKPLNFGKYKGQLITETVPLNWILFMLDRVDETTAKGLIKIGHERCDKTIMNYCISHNVADTILSEELQARYKKKSLIELTIQEKIQFCEIIKQNTKG